MPEPTALSYALRYAERGWAVLPTVAREKRPHCMKGKAVVATTEVHQIRAWWDRWPRAGVGIACGAVSGLVVLDVDPRHGGGASLERIQADHGELTRTATVKTGGNGAHIYYRLPAGTSVPCRTPLAGYSGLDLRGDRGNVHAPPSVHASGQLYRWHIRERLAEAPAWLLELGAREEPAPVIRRLRPGDRRLRDLSEALDRCPKILARFHRNTMGLKDESPSGVDMGLARGCALVGLDEDAIMNAIVESRAQAGLPMPRPGALRATARRALHGVTR
jgi:hypothetical protein